MEGNPCHPLVMSILLVRVTFLWGLLNNFRHPVTKKNGLPEEGQQLSYLASAQQAATNPVNPALMALRRRPEFKKAGLSSLSVATGC